MGEKRKRRCYASPKRTRAFYGSRWPMVLSYLAQFSCLVTLAAGCGSKSAPTPGVAVNGAAVPAENTTFASLLSSGYGDTEALASSIAAFQGRVEARVILSFTAVTDDDLARLEFPDTVHEIDLSGTAVTDRGVEHLTRVRNLETLVLMDTPITEAVVDTLKQMPRLCEARLDNTNVPVNAQLDLITFLAPRAQARAARLSAARRRQ